MALKKYKPITPGLRYKTVASFDEITKDYPEKSLVKGKKKISGRNSAGIITVRRRGGGHKRRYRFVDFKRKKHNIYATVLAIEYDPNRSAYIALVEYEDGEKSYFLAPLGLKVGQKLISGENVRPDLGNRVMLKNIPLGMEIYNIEIQLGKGGQLVRSAGTSARLLSKEGDYVSVRMPSGEVRLIHQNCFATIGRIGNIEHGDIIIGKAGRNRWLGKRPKVRGTAMNAVDHPHGGGKGKTKGKHPRTPWGKPSKGYRTRKKNKFSNQFIVQSRKFKKRG